jgi:redox-sensitive bicupin YhaK (pirin superfamily)
MVTLRKSEERGHANRGWLNSYFTFSFADYYDEAHMGFRSLRVINDDVVQGGKGFGAHAHRDMEIISYVLEGHLTHRDSMGEQHTVGPNTVQAMSAGTGVVHSEFNASPNVPVHFLQIWIVPNEEDLEPSYQQFPFAPEEKQGQLRLLAGPEHVEGSALIHQDARVYACQLGSADRIEKPMVTGRHAWVQVASGNLALNGYPLKAGDGAAISDEKTLVLEGAAGGAELLLFDLS